MDDGGNYFGYEGQELELSRGVPISKLFMADSYHVSDQSMHMASRDRLLSRQSYLQTNTVQGQNRNIELNDGTNNRLIIGYRKGGF